MASSLTSLLVHLDGTVRAEVRLELARQFAAQRAARVSALFAVVPRFLSILPLAGGVPSVPTRGEVDPNHRMRAMDVFSGRPALILPYAGSASVTPSTVLIAWKSTRECARALTAALPFLQGATRVHLVDADGDETQPARGDVREYLRLHGIAKVKEHAKLSERRAGEDLLSCAADCGAEMMVMGCYGHSRARELVLGGATRTVLESMTLPVLMAH